MLKVVHDETEANETGAASGSSSLLDEIVRDGAQAYSGPGILALSGCYVWPWQ